MTKLTRVGRVMVPVANQDDAIRFYTETLGFKVAADVPFGESDRWVEVTPPAGGVSLALVPPQGNFQPGRMTGIGLESDDVRADHVELKGRGVDVDDDLMGGGGSVPLLFFFRDNNNNHLMVGEAR